METFRAGSETGRVIKTFSVLICEHRLPHVELRCFASSGACSQDAPTLQSAGTQFIVSRYYVTLQQCICHVLKPASKKENTAFFFVFILCLCPVSLKLGVNLRTPSETFVLSAVFRRCALCDPIKDFLTGNTFGLLIREVMKNTALLLETACEEGETTTTHR